ncbi:LysR family transcriptional regulator [Thiohalomonas denitrificans]|uniref:DNA-binding transcriptional regulator, LysR family n=1 Tax=Thiohalomonas denitrificans TaxID=415747 RepID=A0A1G5Q1H7_9GAMM|nr:LysR family transcriptional regulator [Thiohalomonas denitrificans]SCZ55261.1 DNA-binding transcriptional regulator, LysR family [Thiohalomonas denitrificans]
MPIRHATLHQLRVFDTLARHRSVTRAAEELHLSPSAISIQCRQLAESVGHPLYEQVGRGLHLTAAGEIVSRSCRDVLDRLEQTALELASMQGLECGSLRLAILTTAKYFGPRLLGEFSRQHPEIEVMLFVGNRQQLLERLAANRDDLYILGRPPERLRVIAEPFAENRLALVASADHTLAGETDIAPVLLNGLPFILREEGSGTRRAAERFFDDHGITPRTRMELGSNEAIKQTVAGGLGVAVLSESTVQAELASGELVRLDVRGFPLRSDWFVAHLAGKKLSPAAVAFRESLFSMTDALKGVSHASDPTGPASRTVSC